MIPKALKSNLSIGVLIIIGIVGSWLFAINRQQDELVCDEPVAVIEDLVQRSIRSHRFSITNRSSLPVQIVRVEKTCSCTNFRLDKSKLEPGESLNLEMEVSVGERRGRFESILYLLYSTDVPHGSRSELNGRSGTLKNLPLTTRTNVIPHYSEDVESIKFEIGEMEKTVKCKRVHGPSLEIKNAYSNSPAIGTDFRAIARYPNEEWEIKVKFNRELWFDGFVGSELVIETNSELEPVRKIPISIRAE